MPTDVSDMLRVLSHCEIDSEPVVEERFVCVMVPGPVLTVSVGVCVPVTVETAETEE